MAGSAGEREQRIASGVVLELHGSDVHVIVDPASGGRIASLRVDDLETLVTSATEPTGWGSYPMVPFAGRVRDGRFHFSGAEHELVRNFGPHAIHGFGFGTAWTEEPDGSLELDLSSAWAFGGRATQRFELFDDRLEMELSVHATTGSLPASLGWHPWFRRDLGRGGPAELSFAARSMYRRDRFGIPTGELVDVPAGPWDDCFTELGPAPRITWSGALILTIEHDCDHLVVYDEPEHALCVEPQTGPPDAFNIDPFIVEPGRPLVANCTLRWS